MPIDPFLTGGYCDIPSCDFRVPKIFNSQTGKSNTVEFKLIGFIQTGNITLFELQLLFFAWLNQLCSSAVITTRPSRVKYLFTPQFVGRRYCYRAMFNPIWIT